MKTCKNQSFFAYFKENMDGLSLPVPESLFATQALATATISALLAPLKELGPRATVGELFGATFGIEKVATITALSAAYYVGAVIGSLAIASGRYLACGTSLADVMMQLSQNHITVPPTLHSHLVRHPEIYVQKLPARSVYAARARTYA